MANGDRVPFRRIDAERLARTVQSIEDLRTELPGLLELASKRGAEAVVDACVRRLNVIDRRSNSNKSSIKWIKWILGMFAALFIGGITTALASIIL